MSEYNLTLFEVCELLSKSKKTVSRYIRQGKLNPKEIKSKQGTLEYRFYLEDIENFKKQDSTKRRENELSQSLEDGKMAENGGNIEKKTKKNIEKEIIKVNNTEKIQDDGLNGVLKETIGLLKGQLEEKDKQIERKDEAINSLIERNRENNVLMKGLQDKVFVLEEKKIELEETGRDKADKTGQTDEKGQGGQSEKKYKNGFEIIKEKVVDFVDKIKK